MIIKIETHPFSVTWLAKDEMKIVVDCHYNREERNYTNISTDDVSLLIFYSIGTISFY